MQKTTLPNAKGADTARKWLYPPFLLIVLIAALPVLMAPRLLNIPSAPMYTGGILWAVSVVFKGYLYQPFMCLLPQKTLNIWSTSLLSGIYSAAMELVPAGIYFAFKELTFLEALGFGLGAGSFEAGVIALVMMKSLPETSSAQATSPGWVAYAAPIERTIATIGHTGTRGLVYMGVVYHNALWPLMAIVFFSFFDGVANYGKRAGWNWQDGRVLGRYYSAIFLLAAASAVLFISHF